MKKREKKILQAAASKLNCDDERCIIKSSEFSRVAGKDIAKHELETNFKIEGPTDTSLLNNYNIDKTLQQWAKKFSDNVNKFYAYNFNMKDFKRQNDTLATVKIQDLYANGFRTLACVINSDVYSGRGKHWMALFGDMRGTKWSVEFFNSSGNEPVKEFADWLIDTKEAMDEIISKHNIGATAEIIKCTGLEHQKSKTECGVYSLYYIWARLNGIPAQYFKENEIKDILCFELRQHLFHDRARKPVSKFDFNQFKGSANVQWENDVTASEIKRITGGHSDTEEQPHTLTPELIKYSKQLTLHWNSRMQFLSGITLLVDIGKEISMVYCYGVETQVIALLRKFYPKITFTAIIDVNNDVNNDKLSSETALIFGDIETSLAKLIIDKMQPSKCIMNIDISVDANNDHFLGKLKVRPFDANDSTTMWLIVSNEDRGSITKYDAIELRQYLDTHHIRRGLVWHEHDVIGEGLDHCWDCAYEINLLGKYIANTTESNSVTSLNTIANISKFISMELTTDNSPNSLVSPPHGIYKTIRSEDKYELINLNWS